MNDQSENPYINLDIPAIRYDIGLQDSQQELLIYDSLEHRSDFIYKKPFRSGHFSVILIVKESLKIKVNLFEYELKTKQIIIIPPFAIREIIWEDNGVHFVSLLFTTPFLEKSAILGKYFNVTGFLKEGLTSLNKLSETDHAIFIKLTQIISTLLTSNSAPANDDEVIQNLFRALLLKVSQYYEKMPAENPTGTGLIYRFIKLLSQHYLSHREVRFYAEKLNVNEKYLTQVLKRSSDKTARQFITEMVVLEAKVLLSENILSIKEIAGRLNFENQFHFSRFFKQYGGISPTAYRKI